MRTLGKGYAGARKFCTVMNMPPPPTEKAFLSNSCVIGRHIKVIAKETMKKAGEVFSLKKQNNSSGTEPVNCGVSCDGTWQKRGCSSRNGCVTVIYMDTGKVLDMKALSQGCKQCECHEHLDKTSLEYQTWKADHTKCKAHFQGSAPAMEPEGADHIFRRSVERHNLRSQGVNYGPGQF